MRDAKITDHQTRDGRDYLDLSRNGRDYLDLTRHEQDYLDVTGEGRDYLDLQHKFRTNESRKLLITSGL